MSRAGFALRVALLPVAVLAGVWLHGQSASVAMTLMPVPDTGPLVKPKPQPEPAQSAEPPKTEPPPTN